MLSNMCLFGKAVSMYSLPEDYLVMNIQVHNLIFYTNFISRLTFEGGKNKIKFLRTYPDNKLTLTFKLIDFIFFKTSTVKVVMVIICLVPSLSF